MGDKPIAHNMVLSFEADDVTEANSLQFLGRASWRLRTKAIRGLREKSS